jgi:hypothetical protein
LQEVHAAHGSYFLPMAFPEGSPTHPAYGAGHATVAGACTTILKAWFKEDTKLVDLIDPFTGMPVDPISHLGQPVSKGECELFHIYFVKYSHQRSSWPCYI